MLYGEEIHVYDAAAEGGSPILIDHATGAIYTKNPIIMGVVKAFGFRVTTAFDYDTLVTEGILSMYKYPLGVSGNKVLLGTIDLTDALALGDISIAAVHNIVVNQTPIAPGIARFNMGDQIAVEVTTQGNGGTYLAGAFQPFIWVNHRGEPFANQSKVSDQSVARTAAY